MIAQSASFRAILPLSLSNYVPPKITEKLITHERISLSPCRRRRRRLLALTQLDSKIEAPAVQHFSYAVDAIIVSWKYWTVLSTSGKLNLQEYN